MICRAVHCYRALRRGREIGRRQHVLHSAVASPEIAGRYARRNVQWSSRFEVEVTTNHGRSGSTVRSAYPRNDGAHQIDALSERDGSTRIGQMCRARIEITDGEDAQPGALL